MLAGAAYFCSPFAGISRALRTAPMRIRPSGTPKLFAASHAASPHKRRGTIPPLMNAVTQGRLGSHMELSSCSRAVATTLFRAKASLEPMSWGYDTGEKVGTVSREVRRVTSRSTQPDEDPDDDKDSYDGAAQETQEEVSGAHDRTRFKAASVSPCGFGGSAGVSFFVW